MKLALARLAMTLAERCLGDRRRGWSQAMLAEFDEAAEAGEAVSFAFGCLVSAWRELPAQEEGRWIIARHVLACGVFIPVAAVLLFGLATGLPHLTFEQPDLHGGLARNFSKLAINDGNRAGVGPLAALTFALGIGHLYVAWTMLDGCWPRVLVAGRIAAAITVTSVMLTGLLFLRVADAMPQAVTIALELLTVRTLIRWESERFDVTSHEPEVIITDRP